MSAFGQSDYPNRPVRIFVGYVPSGGPDYIARIVAPKLSDIFGQSFVVENRPGAGGSLATAMLAKMAPDGYNLLLGETGQLEIAPYVYRNLAYDPVRDLTPIALITDAAGVVLISHERTGIKTIQDLIARAKARPDELNYGSVGAGTRQHMAIEVFKTAAGINMTHVPYKGAGQTLPAILGGEIQILSGALQTFSKYIESGTFHVLAVLGPERLKAIPNVPSLSELYPKYRGFESQAGILAPAGLPAGIRDRLAAAIKEAVDTPEIRDRLSSDGTRSVRYLGPEAYGDLIKANLKKYEEASRLAGVAPT
ncbi:MAG: Bug family tripartite tricarboxylate transporter substrate binding protein [Burkholderiaceae bacterium]